MLENGVEAKTYHVHRCQIAAGRKACDYFRKLLSRSGGQFSERAAGVSKIELKPATDGHSNDYELRSDKVAHAWMVGATDPSNGLPAGHIFVTGFLDTLWLRALGGQPPTSA